MLDSRIGSYSLTGVILLFTVHVEAADTLEVFDSGAADLELHFSAGGFGSGTGEEAAGGELVAGYGLADRVSLYSGAALEIADGIASLNGGYSLGVYGTPLETDHIDVDIVAGINGGKGLGDLAFKPGIEINLDRHPEMMSFGLYVDVFFMIRPTDDGEPTCECSSWRGSLDIPCTTGIYYTLVEDHQLLIQHDLYLSDTLKNSSVAGSILALGYNVVLTDEIELISEVSVGFTDGERWGWGCSGLGFSIGVVATL